MPAPLINERIALFSPSERAFSHCINLGWIACLSVPSLAPDLLRELPVSM
jgi:hypothetical protein